MLIIDDKRDGNVIMSASDDKIRVDFVELGEGYNGEYDPDDPDDNSLVRFDVYCKEKKDKDWCIVEDASYCTSIPVKSPIDELKDKIREIHKQYRSVASKILSGASVKQLGEKASWI